MSLCDVSQKRTQIELALMIKLLPTYRGIVRGVAGVATATRTPKFQVLFYKIFPKKGLK